VAPTASNCGELRAYLRGGSWRDSGTARVVVEDGGLEERPGGKAKLLGCFAMVEVQRGRRSTAEQGHGVAEQCRAGGEAAL
jgi:hypothetical protein